MQLCFGCRQKAIFKTITLVLVVYGISWCIPNFLLIIMTVLGSAEGIGYMSSLIAVGTGVHSSGNVLIYALKHKEIGGHMKMFLGVSSKTTNRVTTLPSSMLIQPPFPVTRHIQPPFPLTRHI
jgi:hypothetical protein